MHTNGNMVHALNKAILRITVIFVYYLLTLVFMQKIMQLDLGEDQKQKFALREFNKNCKKYFMLT